MLAIVNDCLGTSGSARTQLCRLAVTKRCNHEPMILSALDVCLSGARAFVQFSPPHRQKSKTCAIDSFPIDAIIKRKNVVLMQHGWIVSTSYNCSDHVRFVYMPNWIGIVFMNEVSHARNSVLWVFERSHWSVFWLSGWWVSILEWNKTFNMIFTI